jgi:hypothetical protein
MRLTIIPDDKFVSVDGVGYLKVEFTVDSNIHAVQWIDTRGWIEYKEIDFHKPNNEDIYDISQFQNVIDAWTERHQAESIVVNALR